MIRVERFKAIHAVNINLRKADTDDLKGLDISTASKRWEKSEYAKTLFFNDDIICCFGGLVENDFCHTWLITSNLVEIFKKTVIKEILKIHFQGMNDHIKKFYTYVNAKDPRAKRFIEFLGYERIKQYKFIQNNKVFRRNLYFYGVAK